MRKTAKDIILGMKGQDKNHEVMPTGFRKIDKHLDGGFFTKELIVIGAHTGIGKSQIAGQIMLSVAEKGFKSAYFSLEISNEMVISRLLGIKTNIKPTMIRFGSLKKEEFEAKKQAEVSLLTLKDLVSFYDDCYTLPEITKEVKANKYEFVVVDFIQNVMEKNTDEYSRLSKASITLQKLSKQTGCTILVLSQLSNMAARAGSSAQNLEYKGSGSIAMVCDLGFFMERQESGITRLMLKKNRRGIGGVYWELGYQKPGGMIYEK